jgi:hypothetical protein
MALSTTKQVKLEKILLTSADGSTTADLRQFYTDIILYEDIFSSAITAEIYLSLSVPLENFIGIGGSETIDIEFQSEKYKTRSTGLVKTKLVVYKLSDRNKSDKPRKYRYTLNCASPEFIHNEKVRISKFYDKKHHETIGDLYGAWVKDFKKKKKFVPKSKSFLEKESILIPNWSPLHAINYVLNKCAVSKNTPKSDFMFYETLKPNGGSEFHLQSFEDMTNTNAVKEYIHVFDKAVDPETQKRMDSASPPQYNVYNFKVKSASDYLQELTQGTLAGKTIIFDMTKKRWDLYEYNYFEEIGDKNPTLPEPSDKEKETPYDSFISVIPKRRGLFTNKEQGASVDEPKENSSHAEQTAWRRNLFMGSVSNTKCIVETSGDSNLRVAQTVKWDIPSTEPEVNTQVKQDHLADLWVATSVTHHINREIGYTQTVELLKDSVDKKYPTSSFFAAIAKAVSTALSVISNIFRF